MLCKQHVVGLLRSYLHVYDQELVISLFMIGSLLSQRFRPVKYPMSSVTKYSDNTCNLNQYRLKSEEANFNILSSGSIVHRISIQYTLLYNNIPLVSIAMLNLIICDYLSYYQVNRMTSNFYELHVMCETYTDDQPPINYAKLDSTIDMFESSSPGHLVTQQS